ncbi:MAG: TonB-dependent receptor plug domain-containing protein, partial [Gammaproteobacteria bacterium]|nr:TonB-dependent receptor plug domain-containing protein [Gammaproteobacteria bacterium]
QDPIGDKINIRGIFTSEVPSLEQSVSTFVDGVNRGRGTQVRLPLLDLERVEVLRGPQGTLFGKNTVGGALNLITRKPTPEFTSSLTAGYEFELEETSVAGVLSGPLSDAVRGRLAFSGRDQGEGFVDNRFYNESEPISQDASVRAILDWDATPTMLVRLRAEYQDFDVDGQPFALRSAGALAPVIQTFGVSGGSLTRTAIGQTPGSPLEIGSSGTMTGDAHEAALTLEQTFASGAKLEILGAFSALDFKRRLDADFSPLDLFGFDDTEDYSQRSLSLRFLSSDEGRARFVAGVYYQDIDLELTGLSSQNNPVGAALLGGICQTAGLSPADAQQLAASAATGRALDSVSQLARAGSASVVNTCLMQLNCRIRRWWR